MEPTILIVEDNEDLAFNLKLMLEVHDFKVDIAYDGKEALKILKSKEKTPDAIVCDIMMPQMDGYDLFKKVYNNPKWVNIPFIFLSALSNPEEIRKGKELGVDDYITKPFNEKDLLATIKGKIGKFQRQKELNEKINPIIDQFKKVPENSDDTNFRFNNHSILLIVSWDDKVGPKMEAMYPKNVDVPFSVEDIGLHLFQSATLIYGQGQILNPEGILLNLETINQAAYAYFDSYPQKEFRSKQKQFMLALIAPKINYLESLKIKELFRELSNRIKQQDKYQIELYWKEICSCIDLKN